MADVIVVESVEAAAGLAADRIAGLVASAQRPTVGVATGSTPLAVYRELAARVDRGELDLRGVTAFALDEYVGLRPGHPASYRAVLEEELVRPLGLDPARLHVPDPDPAGLATSGERFEAAIAAAGGVDVQLLGIGANGHIGFNEPGSSLASRTRVKTLTRRTREDNARFFESPDEVPRHCVTQGIGTILSARRLLLLAFGTAKAQALVAAVEGPVTASVPASAIQLHPEVTVIADAAAAARLRDLDYYREVQAHRHEVGSAG